MEECRSKLPEVDMDLGESCSATLSSDLKIEKTVNLTVMGEFGKSKDDPSSLELKTADAIGDNSLTKTVQFSLSHEKAKDSSSFESIKNASINSPSCNENETDMNVDERGSSSSEEGGNDARTQAGEFPSINTLKSNDSVCYDSRQKHSLYVLEQEEVLFQSLVPKVNCQEKFIICIDMSSDMNQLPFKLGNGTKHQPLSMVKRVIEIFIHNKHRISKNHEYALVALNETASWVNNFSGDPKVVCAALENFIETKPCDGCDLASLFKLISESSCLPSISSITGVPPFVLRVILIYGRSNCVPEFKDEMSSFQSLKESKNFFFDVIYIHEPPSDDNKCQEIFETFCDMDADYTSYVFELTRNTTKLHNCMAKLLCHPLQRPIQRDASYKLHVVEHLA